jgi:hypothetical protein
VSAAPGDSVGTPPAFASYTSAVGEPSRAGFVVRRAAGRALAMRGRRRPVVVIAADARSALGAGVAVRRSPVAFLIASNGQLRG